MIVKPILIAASTSVAMLLSTAVQAAESHIGDPTIRNGMRISALYIQAVKMDMGHGSHAGHAKSTQQSGPDQGHESHAGHHMHHAGSHATTGDLHLEAKISASADNDWGFSDGDWIPYLNIQWTVAKKGSDWSKTGTFLPMIANDGPHYGDNVNLDGPGKYVLTYRISPPDPGVFPRHFDRETGVSEWWQPFDLSWEFIYTGTGKKGGY